MTEEQCQICIKNATNYWNCEENDCNFKCCIPCIKRYLLMTSDDPKCMKCKKYISKENFVDTLSKNWRLNTYKPHRKCILFDREVAKLPETSIKIANIKAYNKMATDIKKLKSQLALLEHDQNNLRYKNIPYQNTNYKYPCSIERCKGFVDHVGYCASCENTTCIDCLKIKIDDHQCNPDDIETAKIIKETTKPCPGCSTSISKIVGCNQMFCTYCATSFHWITGEIDLGQIHNPHAYNYFQNNPDRLNDYMKRIRNVNDNNFVLSPYQVNLRLHEFTKTTQSMSRTNPSMSRTNQSMSRMFSQFIRSINYYRSPRNQSLDNIKINKDNNEDLRIRWLNCGLITNRITLTESLFKTQLHRRDKQRKLHKRSFEIVSKSVDQYYTMIMELLHEPSVEKLNNFIRQSYIIYKSTRLKIDKISKKYNLKPVIDIRYSYSIEILNRYANA